MRIKRYLPVIVVIACFIFGGCAGIGYRPVVDMKGEDPEVVDNDMAYCRGVANQASPVNGGIINVLIDGMYKAAAETSYAADYTDDDNGGSGGIIGDLTGTTNAVQTHNSVWRSCLRGRNHKVIN